MPEAISVARSLSRSGRTLKRRKAVTSPRRSGFSPTRQAEASPGHTFVLVNTAGQIIWRSDWLGHGKPMYVEVEEVYKDVAEWLTRAG